MKIMAGDSTNLMAAKFAADFMNRLQLELKAEERCEWSCVLWSKEHWAGEAQKAKINLHQTKERTSNPTRDSSAVEALFANSQFLNTVAQVYSKLFDGTETSCPVKVFHNCPFMDQRKDLLNKGVLASAFVTLLHKATLYSMLDEHPLDSGLINEEFGNVYGIDLTSYDDLENSLRDGRFVKLVEATTRRARQLAGLSQPSA